MLLVRLTKFRNYR